MENKKDEFIDFIKNLKNMDKETFKKGIEDTFYKNLITVEEGLYLELTDGESTFGATFDWGPEDFTEWLGEQNVKIDKEYEKFEVVNDWSKLDSDFSEYLGNLYQDHDTQFDLDTMYNSRDFLQEELVEQLDLDLAEVHSNDKKVSINPSFNELQMYEIRRGLKEGLDVSKYADPKFNKWQMREIRLGLKEGLDVSKYADPSFNDTQMNEIRQELGKKKRTLKKKMPR